MSALRVGVIGVGHLGQHHARLLSSMPGAELVAVVDANLERARAIAGQYGGVPHADTSALPALDAVEIGRVHV